jgi:hypothetical protein
VRTRRFITPAFVLSLPKNPDGVNPEDADTAYKSMRCHHPGQIDVFTVVRNSNVTKLHCVQMYRHAETLRNVPRGKQSHLQTKPAGCLFLLSSKPHSLRCMDAVIEFQGCLTSGPTDQCSLWFVCFFGHKELCSNLRNGDTAHKELGTVHRPGDDPRKECEECGNARGSNVRYYPT